MKKTVYFLAVALIVSLVCNYKQCTRNDVLGDTVTVERTDTQYITKTDTVPVVKRETITKYVDIPVYKDSIVHDTLLVPVVQRTYTDDSTYTAYVSGLQYDSFPRLDSITVQQRYIYHEIDRNITVEQKRRLRLGVQAGAGIGVFSRKPDVYIGIGLQW